MKLTELDLAEAQLYGFAHASKGYSVKDLVDAMNLTKAEWFKLRDNSYLKPLDKEELDEMFGLQIKQ